jgi:hypothetical protein
MNGEEPRTEASDWARRSARRAIMALAAAMLLLVMSIGVLAIDLEHRT